MLEIKIANRLIASQRPCFIIAEAGVNHNGKLKLAKKLVDRAKFTGADAIKFQVFKAEFLVTDNAPQAEYQKKNAQAKSQLAMLRRLELSFDEFQELFYYCRKKKIIFLATPFDRVSADFLYKLGIAAFKISSADLTNTPLLKQIASYKKPVILSTGMANLGEVKDALKEIYKTGNRKIALLQCTTDYPAKTEDVNLRVMDTLKKEFNSLVGYSDHTLGIEIAVAAVARGACILEKHLTLAKNLKGPDHRSSLAPDEFKYMVESIRKIEKAMGTGLKKPVNAELKNMRLVRKSVVAARAIKPGTSLTAEVLAIKRPATGIAPRYLSFLKNKRAKNFIRQDEVITWSKLY